MYMEKIESYILTQRIYYGGLTFISFYMFTGEII